ncbi:MAG: molybdenum cofactor biosynthesis protein MoaE [Phycisphaerae bacterium]|nr:molybdenum cofactor biosynthesis protein MoaE [Phycisphaerae bacterium]
MSEARVSVRIAEGALEGRVPAGSLREPPPPPPPTGAGEGVGAGAAGAVVVFEGVVRAMEGGRRIAALRYEAYEPMASRMLAELARATAAQHGLLAIEVEHSVGEVVVGARSFRLVVEAAHRREALEAMEAFIVAMKRDVPIWKTPVWAEDGGGA